MSKKFYSLQVRDDARAVIYIYDFIGEDIWGDGTSAKSFARDLAELGEVTDIDVHINSPGGNVFDGQAIYNQLLQHAARINVYIDGIAASIASVIAMAGDTIYMPGNTLMMIHDPWSLAMGSAKDMRKTADVLDKIKDTIIAAYQRKTDMSAEDIAALMEDETWMTADEAKEWGFVDEQIADIVEDSMQAKFAANHFSTLAMFKNTPDNLRIAAAAAAQTSKPKHRPSAGEVKDMGDKSTQNKPAEQTPVPDPQDQNQQQTPVDQQALRKEGAQAENQRVSEIRNAVKVAGINDENFVNELVNDTTCDINTAREKIFAKLADSAGKPGSGMHMEVTRDERDTVAEGVANAILHRLAPQSHKLDDNGRQYRGMSLIEISRDCLNAAGISTRGMPRVDIAAKALSSTSDLPAILSDAANKRLRQAYEEQMPTYRIWARQAPSAPDFKNINVIQMSGAPDLLKVNEGGEFEYGYLNDGEEVYKVLTYGRIVPMTRQQIVNDDLRAFDRLLTGFAGAAQRLENRLVYAQILDNPKLADGKALFHADHNNFISTGTEISVDSLRNGRALMRKQKGLQKEELNIAPSFLIVGPDNEQLAYQFTSANYQPDSPSNINEFRAGGRTALEPVVDSLIDGYEHYLAADNTAVDTVEYCWLEGYEGVWMESEMGFDVDGMKMKARLDFAAKAVDYRGLVKNNGAEPA